MLIDQRPLDEILIVATDLEHLTLVPADRNLTGAEVELVPLLAREYRLKEALAPVAGALRLRLHRLPAQPRPAHRERAGRGGQRAHPAAVRVLRARGDLRADRHPAAGASAPSTPRLEIEGVLLTMVDERTNLTQQVIGEIREPLQGQGLPDHDPAQRPPRRGARASASRSCSTTSAPRGPRPTWSCPELMPTADAVMAP